MKISINELTCQQRMYWYIEEYVKNRFVTWPWALLFILNIKQREHKIACRRGSLFRRCSLGFGRIMVVFTASVSLSFRCIVEVKICLCIY